MTWASQLPWILQLTLTGCRKPNTTKVQSRRRDTKIHIFFAAAIQTSFFFCWVDVGSPFLFFARSVEISSTKFIIWTPKIVTFSVYIAIWCLFLRWRCFQDVGKVKWQCKTIQILQTEAFYIVSKSVKVWWIYRYIYILYDKIWLICDNSDHLPRPSDEDQ